MRATGGRAGQAGRVVRLRKSRIAAPAAGGLSVWSEPAIVRCSPFGRTRASSRAEAASSGNVDSPVRTSVGVVIDANASG